jgi:tetratricopeptide (TPR) repeat protein
MIMFPPWRFKLREAQVALEQGRLDEAADLAGEATLRDYLPVRQLLEEVGEQLSRRALERAAAGDFAAAWRDLEQARQLGGETANWQRLSQAVAEVAMGDIVQHLAASDFPGATSRLEVLDKRKLPGVALTTLREVTKRLESARKLGQRGKFAEAGEQLGAALALRPDLRFLEEKRELCQQRAEQSRVLHEQLHAAIAAADWTKVATVAGELLEISPESRVARDARKQAWDKVGAPVGDSRRLAETQHWTGIGSRGDASHSAGTEGATKAPSSQKSSRFMLWIDAVGGYLVCLGSEIVIGQSTPGTSVDVPIQADISRKHAKIVRHTEGYVLEPLGGRVTIDGRSVKEPVLLADGQEIGLGDAVKLVFRKPHVLSSSARLEITSGHRTLPHADGVILMAESCVLGPKWQSHVVCRDWANDVVLYRSEERIMCRALESVEIDGQLHDRRGPIRPGSQVVGSDFSFSVEAV